MTVILRRLALLVALGLVFAFVAAARPQVSLRISEDPYITGGQHRTQVEPHAHTVGSTTVAVFQTGRRFSGGGSVNIGFASSLDGGLTWTDDVLPGITVAAGGPWTAVTNTNVAHDDQHNVWLAQSLGFTGTPGAIVVNRSTDGLVWSNPVTVTSSSDFLDKGWAACDNWTTSPKRGTCYVAWSRNFTLETNKSTNGGLSWTNPRPIGANGLGVQLLPRPSGQLLAVWTNGAIFEARSKDAGRRWGNVQTISTRTSHRLPIMRDPAFLSSTIDAAGTSYVIFTDCRYRPGCSANDIVLTKNVTNRNWTPVSRIPTGPLGDGADRFIPAIAVQPGTSGATAHLAVVYHYLPVAACTLATCQLHVTMVESFDGGSSWGTPEVLFGPMNLTWLADTTQGRMTGDYIGVTFDATGRARPVFSGANPPSGGLFDQATYTIGP